MIIYATDGFYASFTMVTGEHYITMLLASHGLFALQYLWWKMLGNPSIGPARLVPTMCHHKLPTTIVTS